MYLRSVPNCSRISAPLNKRLGKKEPSQLQTLTAAEKNVVMQINCLLKSLPELALPQADAHLAIVTDACDTQLGLVLL